MSYDALGRVTSQTLPDPDGAGGLASPVQSYVYDKLGRVLSATDPLGKVTAYTFDTLGRMTQVTAPDPDGAGPLSSPVTSYAYDLAGQLLGVTAPMSRVTSFSYDALSRLVLQTLPDPDGAGAGIAPFTIFEYDAAGNLTAQEDALARRTTFAYNSLNWRTSVTDPASGVTSFTYDDVGNLLSLTDPEANTTSWTYDNLDRQISETNELSLTRSFSFDLVGNLVSQTDRNGRVTEYDYDNLYRMLAERWIGSGSSTIRTLSFEYDAAGQLVSASDPSASYDYIYDDLGRVTELTQNLAGLLPTIVLAQSYDANSRRTQLSATIGSTDDYVNGYSYDALGRLTQLTQGESGYGNSVAEKRVNFSYNASSQFASINRYADLAGTMTVAATAYSYDGTGRLTAMEHANGLANFASYGWTFDEGNRILQFVSSVDGTVDYTYDANQQLTGADYDYQTDESYSYDENGNRTNSGYDIGDNNQTLSDGTYDYEYDDEGNRTKKTVIATGAWTEYVWDHRNRLTQVVQKNSGGSVLTTIDYEYDVFDRRVARVSTPAVGAAISQHFVYDGDHIALQFDGGTLTHRYLYGPVVDQILADEQIGTGDVLWPLTDNLGSVRDIAIYNAGTDTTTIANHIVYDAFGRVISETNSAVDLLFGYTGRDWDAQAELQYNRARWYDPKIGQWLSEDPIGFEAGDANVRRYVGNGVTSKVDPSGLVELNPDDRNSLTRLLNEPLPTSLGKVNCVSPLPPGYYGPAPLGPDEMELLGRFGGGLLQGAVGALVVSGTAAAAVPLGVPLAVATTGLLVAGSVGGIGVIWNSVEDPSPANLAHNIGLIAGGGFVGRAVGFPLASRMSPVGNKPPSARISIPHEIKQGFWPRSGVPLARQVSHVMGQGPTTGGAAGTVTLGGAGIGKLINYMVSN